MAPGTTMPTGEPGPSGSSPTLLKRLGEAVGLTAVAAALFLVSFLLIRYTMNLQGANVPLAARQEQEAIRKSTGVTLCEYPGCKQPAKWSRTVGSGSPHVWCEEHLRGLASSPTPGIFGLVVALPGLAAAIGAAGSWINLVRALWRAATGTLSRSG